MLENIITKTSFTVLVEELVAKEGLTYIQAVLHICDERQIDPSDVNRVISPTIKSKIEVEAMESNLLPKTNSLPFGSKA